MTTARIEFYPITRTRWQRFTLWLRRACRGNFAIPPKAEGKPFSVQVDLHRVEIRLPRP